MSSLVTIVAEFRDGANRRIKNLNVKSRYKGSTLENLGKTDRVGIFIFRASPNRTIEILIKPPNESNYSVFKTFDSSQGGSWDNPTVIMLPKPLEQYLNTQPKKNGLVSTLFKIVDSNGKALKNFPVQTRPKGKNSFERTTDESGILKVDSSPNRDIEVLVLNSKDQFVLKSSINSRNGSQQPITIQLDEPFEKFKSTGVINLYDRDGSHYIIKKTNVEVHFLETNKKKVFVISNGKINMNSMVGQKMQLTVFKPDGKPLTPVIYLAKRVKEQPFSLHMDVDITNSTTDTNKPATDKVVKAKVKCKTCGKSLDIDIDFIKEVAPNAHENFQNTLLLLPTYLNKYSANSCKDLVNILAQGKIETGDFKKLRENLNYTKKTFGSPEKINSISPTAIEKGFQRRGMGKYTKKQKLDFIWKNLAENDAAYGFHLYGNEKYPNRDYRGRGLIHLTHFETYEKCAKETGLDIVNNPKLIETDYNVALHTASWYWKDQRNGKLMTLTATDSANINSDSVTESISIIVNGGKIKLEQRIAEKKTIAKKFIKKYGACK